MLERTVRRRADAAEGHARRRGRHADAFRLAHDAGHSREPRLHAGRALSRAPASFRIGKTNVPEFGILPTTESKLYGPAHNPWNLAHSTGGSSGGSGAAVAAGIVPIAHATDGGGSIRIPAACNGLVGLKVSRGRVTQGPDAADSTIGLSVDNVVTRSVRDTAAVLDHICAPDYGDPYFAPPPEGSYLEAIARQPKRLRIAYHETAQRRAALPSRCRRSR